MAAASSEWATKPEDRSRLWKARHNAYYAALALAPGKQAFATDACVPISRLTDCVLETQADVMATGLVAPIVGHVGDGNFHLVVLFDPAQPDERGKAEALAARVSMRAIAMGGTCTGEHGIGVHKLDALVAEHGDAVAVMQTIKRALDPRNIMNPGKTVPLELTRADLFKHSTSATRTTRHGRCAAGSSRNCPASRSRKSPSSSCGRTPNPGQPVVLAVRPRAVPA